MWLPRRPSVVLLGLAGALTLGACSEEPRAAVVDSRIENLAVDGPERPLAPEPLGTVRTSEPVTVLDTGDGPQVCVGQLALSMPPQCSGLPLVAWEWGEQEHERNGDVRWTGWVVLEGTFDGEVLTVADVLPAEAAGVSATARETPCPAPEGGWAVVDPARTTQEALDAVRARVMKREGTTTWLDLSGASADAPGVDAPTEGILNVATTDDVSAVERQVRTVWGGKLCVTTAYAGRAEVRRDLEGLPGVLEVRKGEAGQLEAEVLFDDGTLAAWVFLKHGTEATVKGFFVPVT